MGGIESEFLTPRGFGDGKVGYSNRYDIDWIINPNNPVLIKVYRQATSNGCYQPNHYLEEIAKKHTEIKDPEAIYWLAFKGYTQQNTVYNLMKFWAAEKEDKSLFTDITKTPHRRNMKLKFEENYVPDDFKQGTVRGMAYDPVFFICESISRV